LTAAKVNNLPKLYLGEEQRAMKAKPQSPRPSNWAGPVATVLGIGHIPWAPGTWASLATTLCWWLLTWAIRPGWQVVAAVLLVAIIMTLGIPAATRVARKTGRKDPQSVVIDEVAGQLIPFIAVPVSWKSLLLGFILFRGFDIVKPPPAQQLEQLPEGWGIVMDDVAAGVYAFGIMQILLHTGLLPK
jgi:phosphatidylglycerophosphatase A